MLTEIFKKPKPILGKLQLLALPGAPGWDGHWETLITRAEQEATALATAGVDGLIIENFHDAPYTRDRMDVAGAIAMAMLTRRIRQFTNLPVGISILRNDPETALAVALNTKASFIRLPLVTGALLTETGMRNSRFNELMHYKKRLKTAFPYLLADVSLNHRVPSGGGVKTVSPLDHLITVAGAIPQEVSDFSVVLSDVDIPAADLAAFKAAVPQPVLIENRSQSQQAETYYAQADGLILEAGMRRSTASQPDTPPAIDMSRAEELVNRLKKVVPVTEMDPDIFLKR